MTKFLSVGSQDRASWTLLGCGLLALLSLQLLDPFTVAPGTAALPVAGLLLLAGLALGGTLAGWRRLAAASIAFLQMTLFTFLGVALAYEVAAHAGSLWDARLASWDQALGLDWPAITGFVDRSPLLAAACSLAYHSLIPQMITTIVGLAALSRFRTLRVSVCAAILAGLATIAIAGLMPAVGNLSDPAMHRNLAASIAWQDAPLITGLRDGTQREIDLRAMTGIVSFPSYHAALAAIFIWSFRAIRPLRVAGPLWAVLTILATPLGGGHYGVDVLAGLVLGAISIPAARWLVARRPSDQRSSRPDAYGASTTSIGMPSFSS